MRYFWVEIQPYIFKLLVNLCNWPVSHCIHIVYLQFDLGGSLPPIIINRVLKRQPLTIHYLRQHLMKTHALETLPTPSNTMEDSHRCSSHNSARPYEETTPVDEFIGHRHKPSVSRPHSEHWEEDQGSYHALASNDSVWIAMCYRWHMDFSRHPKMYSNSSFVFNPKLIDSASVSLSVIFCDCAVYIITPLSIIWFSHMYDFFFVHCSVSNIAVSHPFWVIWHVNVIIIVETRLSITSWWVHRFIDSSFCIQCSWCEVWGERWHTKSVV